MSLQVEIVQCGLNIVVKIEFFFYIPNFLRKKCLDYQPSYFYSPILSGLADQAQKIIFLMIQLIFKIPTPLSKQLVSSLGL